MTEQLPWKTAFAPATVANIGPGFDVLGLALDESAGLGDTCEVRLVPGGDITITVTGDDGRLPTNPKMNVASVAAASVLALADVRTGLEIRLHKGLPLGSGLGSSAASAASAAIATNAALGNPLTRSQLIAAGREGEKLACGSPHPDNVVPALLGGVLLMVDDEHEGLSVVSLPIPDSLRVTVVCPDLVVNTSDARSILPKQVSMGDAVANMGRLALLVSAFYDSDLERIGKGCIDRLHQPYRSSLVPGFENARLAALDAGALAAGLSGSGPAMFALANGNDAAEMAGRAFKSAFESMGISAKYTVARVACST